MVSNAQQLVIKLSDDLEPSASYTLSMDFAGPLTDDLRGLYLSTYTQGNETVYALISHINYHSCETIIIIKKLMICLSYELFFLYSQSLICHFF